MAIFFTVIPAKAGIHVDFELKPKMDSRFRENDEISVFLGFSLVRAVVLLSCHINEIIT